ncbi:MAG: hypothetical protein KZQ90_14760 [Candidatus Thiodiazotropha sp. (ex Codakia rugifera)]|nr:hypothetical protein [Candidatus Thiodiazotropha sp. (ex Codakia rugifera)]
MAPDAAKLRRLFQVLTAAMDSKYETIKKLHHKVNCGGNAELLKDALSLLENWGINRRTDDGVLYQINISKSENGIFVVGLRYIKSDKTFTEDIFVFTSQKPNDVSKYYKGKYERINKEYKGTHKKQNISSLSFTSVNTCSLHTGNNQ